MHLKLFKILSLIVLLGTSPSYHLFCGVQPQMNAEVQLSTLSVFFFLTFGFGVIIMMLILWIWKIRVCSKLSPSKPGKMRNKSVDMHVHESIGLTLMRHAVGLDK